MNKPAHISMLIGVVMWAGSFWPTHADSIEFTILPKSEVILKGSSNVNTFTCSNSSVEGTVRISNKADRSKTVAGTAKLQMKVKDFACGNALMESDMQDALNASENPQIRFTASRGQIVDTLLSGHSGEYYKIRIYGKLTLAGTTRPVSVLFTGRSEQGHFRLDGTKSIDMTDFGVQPPSAMFGMIKAKKVIHLQFDLRLVRQ